MRLSEVVGHAAPLFNDAAQQAILADQNGADHDRAFDDHLPVRPDTEQVEAVIQQRDNRDADKGAMHAADTARQRRAAHNNRGNGVEQQILAQGRADCA